ncbi:hypothetical protein GXW83_24200 [Streptacidiphilus sp. PB12-B1b]|uniref:lectin-like domain-containing protein n=1 Tax=Streptacidiphilus sp. PB12-B1b TaxID=2705012 RepID=UPI0015F9C97A|nr:DUF11 domain-containing protein [Streptacidiphilus sp. PB12-B1b]QMU78347.1 hypothetical protein GXW83_24200 [Streptacidiphilus sp. PB12-B1b]
MTGQMPDTAQQPVQFPITESFTGAAPENPHWRLLGTARLSEGALELTPDTQSKAGTAFLDQPFSSSLGVSIDFDYSCEGGSGQGLGDGFSLYLIDGSRTTEPGARGGALGYSYIKDGSVNLPGVSAGYVGVGFDNFGNFAAPSSGPGGPGRRQDTLGVRGSGDLLTGFAWLAGAEVPGGFRAGWQAGAHLQVTIIGGRLTVRCSSTSDPDGTVLIQDLDLAAGPGQTQMPATFKLGFAAGTGGATAAHRIRNLNVALPVLMPLEMTGPLTAKAGHRISYTIGVQNQGPNDAPDAVVRGEVPAQLVDTEVTCRGENGAVCGAGSTDGGLEQPVSLPRGSKAVITLRGTVDPHYEGTLTTTSRITSATRANTAAQQSGQVTTTAELPLITVGQKIAGQWDQTWPEDAKGWLVSYNLTLAANEHRVTAWEISFDVPERTRINPQQTQWYRVIKDGLEGIVVIGSPGGGSHTIDPGTPLPVDVQLLYPSQSAAGNGELRGLYAVEVANP